MCVCPSWRLNDLDGFLAEREEREKGGGAFGAGGVPEDGLDDMFG